ncbi:glycosyltransferase [Klebsiella sp. RHBSTW-00465]|uniref:glycosyltransferase n=1 Tax=Klebsiella sp. RHBSTW-00465 TaxID=2742650 RepID=UPI0015F57D0D|nr:glycosyltransferase [Klebsiella sp. RHBSTW-00465]MBA7847939.1 glycosyltransferase [Klebsiella sp. RHBSTW-00465]
MKNVAAVLVTYNRVELLKVAIDSLLNQTINIKYIIIINNNSSDGTEKYLNSIQNEKIKYLSLSTNTGGAGGFSAGINYAYKLDIDQVWIMDDDAVASPGALEELLKANDILTSHSITPGFLCSHVLSDDEDCMNVPDITKKRNSTGYFNWPQFASFGIVGVDKATFVSVLITKDIVAEFGLPVKEMFIWGDDTEYTWRISNKYNCYYVAKSKVYHKRVMAKSLSLAAENSDQRIPWYGFLYRNNIYNIRKHGNGKDFIFYLNHMAKDTLNVLLKSKSKKFKKLSIIIKGFISGLFFNPKIDKP